MSWQKKYSNNYTTKNGINAIKKIWKNINDLEERRSPSALKVQENNVNQAMGKWEVHKENVQ